MSPSGKTSTNDEPSVLAKVSEKLPTLTKGQKVAAATGIGIAAATAAGITAIRAARKRAHAEEVIVYHLEPDDEAWKLTVEGVSGTKATFDTKEEGLAAARALANKKAPSELVIHLADGAEQRRHRYEEG